MAKAIGYGRLSHRYSVAHLNPKGVSEGLDMQEKADRLYWEANLQAEGVTWHGFIDDKAVSARSRPFEKRPGGKQVLALLEPGDHLIFDKIDRMWRSLEDFVMLNQLLDSRKITWHVCNLLGASVRRGTSMGDFLIGLFVMLAQLESDRTSERNRDIQASLRADGRYAGNCPLYGMKRVMGAHTSVDGRKGIKTKTLAWDEDKRAAMGLIVHMRDVEKLSFEKIYFQLNERMTAAFGWPPSRDRLGLAHTLRIEKAYIREKQYRILGNPHPHLVCIKQQFVADLSLELITRKETA